MGFLSLSVTSYLFLFLAQVSEQKPPCSLTAVGDDVQVFACSGLKTQSSEVLRILNKIAGDKLDLAGVEAKLNELPRGTGARSIQLSDEQKTNLLTLAKMYPGQKVVVQYPKSDAAAGKTAAEIVSILSAGQWVNSDGSPLAHANELPDAKSLLGIEVLLNDEDLDSREMPKAAIPLTLSLQAMGYARHPGSGKDVPRGLIQLKVGTPP